MNTLKEHLNASINETYEYENEIKQLLELKDNELFKIFKGEEKLIENIIFSVMENQRMKEINIEDLVMNGGAPAVEFESTFDKGRFTYLSVYVKNGKILLEIEIIEKNITTDDITLKEIKGIKPKVMLAKIVLLGLGYDVKFESTFYNF